MKKPVLILMAVAFMSSAAPANIVIDFESAPTAGTFASYTESGVTFTSVGESAMFTSIGPNGTRGLLGGGTPVEELRADIAGGASFVSVDLGDYGNDSDLLFLEVFDSGDNSLDYTQLQIPGTFRGMETLSLSAANIAYAIYGARQAANGSSVYSDNFTYTPAVPAPGAVLLGAVGCGLVGWLRRRRAL